MVGNILQLSSSNHSFFYSVSNQKNGKIDFDDMLVHIGGWGKFQIRLLMVCIPFTFVLAYVGYAPILFLFVPPDYWCKIPEDYQSRLGSNDTETLIKLLIPLDPKTNQRDQCHMYQITSNNVSQILTPKKCNNFLGY